MDWKKVSEKAQNVWVTRPEEFMAAFPAISPFQPDMLADMFGLVESEGDRPQFIFVHPRDYADFRKPSAGWEKVFTEEYWDQEFMDLGMRGYVWGALVITSPEYQRGIIWVAGKIRWLACTVTR